MDLKIVVISDTHGMQEQLGALRGDVLVHCGDMCDGFNSHPGSLDQLDAWFASLEFEVILCVGGNHDFELQERARLTSQGERSGVFEHAVYLEDQAYVHRGIHFWGSPWVPRYRPLAQW